MGANYSNLHFDVQRVSFTVDMYHISLSGSRSDPGPILGTLDDFAIADSPTSLFLKSGRKPGEPRKSPHRNRQNIKNCTQLPDVTPWIIIYKIKCVNAIVTLIHLSIYHVFFHFFC